jgi:hypothetical protein
MPSELSMFKIFREGISMRRALNVSICSFAVLLSLVTISYAQPGIRNMQKQQQEIQREREKAAKEKDKEKSDEKRPPVPTDPKLLGIMKDFADKTMKLAQDYEKGNDLDKARICYEELLHMVPEYDPAKLALQKIREIEASAKKKTLEVFANKDWQDTGITVVPGKPITIMSKGEWTFTITYTIGAEGIAIPENLKDFNLGALIGVIDEGTGISKDLKPFEVANGKTMTFKKPGRLFLRIYDSEVKDNSGKLNVDIHGTFTAGK